MREHLLTKKKTSFSAVYSESVTSNHRKHHHGAAGEPESRPGLLGKSFSIQQHGRRPVFWRGGADSKRRSLLWSWCRTFPWLHSLHRSVKATLTLACFWKWDLACYIVLLHVVIHCRFFWWLLPPGPKVNDGDQCGRLHRSHLHHHLRFHHSLQRQKQVHSVSECWGHLFSPFFQLLKVSRFVFIFFQETISCENLRRRGKHVCCICNTCRTGGRRADGRSDRTDDESRSFHWCKGKLFCWQTSDASEVVYKKNAILSIIIWGNFFLLRSLVIKLPNALWCYFVYSQKCWFTIKESQRKHVCILNSCPCLACLLLYLHKCLWFISILKKKI